MKYENTFVFTLSVALAFVCAKERDPKQFSLFSVVQFKNEQCTSKNTAGLTGVCMTQTECSSAEGGTVDGNCAAGFGVCCILSISACSGTVYRNCTYIDNPSYPTTYTTSGDCSYSVKRCSDDICQIRLDFFDTELMQPISTPVITAGTCTNTILDITPGTTSRSFTTQPPNLCGTLTGQHVYLDSGRQDTAATLKFTLTTSSTSNRWRVKVTQIECSNPNRAPPGCLQYHYDGVTNNVKSFNWDGTATCSTGCLLASTMYRVCFRPEKGMCRNSFAQSNVDSIQDSWDMPESQEDSINNEGESEQGTACQDGFVFIKSDVINALDNFCGSGFLAAISETPANAITGASSAGRVYTTPAGSWEIDVMTNSDIETAAAGFSIDSTQVPCNGI